MIMTLIRRIKRLEILRANMPTYLFTITHEEFITLTLAETAMRHSVADIKSADRISLLRHHSQRDVDHSNYFAIPAMERVGLKAAVMRPRILSLQAAYNTGDHTAYREQQARDKKTLLAKAMAIVERLEIKISQAPQAVG